MGTFTFIFNLCCVTFGSFYFPLVVVTLFFIKKEMIFRTFFTWVRFWKEE